ncbi:MAG: VIT family protein [Alphaproteobacteria bacterium]|nr:MAG: VIT family protein [Alphaproteobacteria bacterium]
MTVSSPAPKQSPEKHFISRVGWLRAAVLGANDGIVSTASLIAGVASAGLSAGEVLTAGVAGLVAGALSMAAGEYVAVSSQADTESSDLDRERTELATMPEAEHEELAGIYRDRGLSPELADQVATELMAGDALRAHARDELGLSDVASARPLQAALSSAASFTAGAALPLGAVLVSPDGRIAMVTTLASVIALGLLGALSARTGGAPVLRAVTRVVFWGGFAMLATAAIGSLFNVPVN